MNPIITKRCSPIEEAIYQDGFQAGAASRDAEVVSLTNQRDYEYVRAENAEQERDQFEQVRDQLRAQINVLREALLAAESALDESRNYPVTYDEVITALSSAPRAVPCRAPEQGDRGVRQTSRGLCLHESKF